MLNSINEINALGIRIYGDVKEMAKASIPVGINKEVSEIPIETVVNALLAFEKAKIIRRYSSREILQEAKIRLKRITKRYLRIT